MDKELNRMLDSYKVADAGPELIERIVAQAGERPSARSRYEWMKYAAMLAIAVLGFTSGSIVAPRQGGQTVVASQQTDDGDDTFDLVILGPNTIEEMML